MPAFVFSALLMFRVRPHRFSQKTARVPARSIAEKIFTGKPLRSIAREEAQSVPVPEVSATGTDWASVFQLSFSLLLVLIIFAS